MKINDGSGLTVLKANPISIEAVLQYSGKAIDPSGKRGLDPKKFYGVFRSAWELSDPKTIESFNGCPLIDEHEMVGEGAKKVDERPADGCIYNVRMSRDLAGVLIADIKIYTDSIRQKIKDGKVELSLGYRCRYVEQKGSFNGVPYDFIQTDLRGNHIALVKHGRCGSGVRVYDSSEAMDADEVLTFDSLEEVENMAKDAKKEEVQVALDSLAECLSGANDELAADVLQFVKNWKPKGTPATDGGEGAPKGGEGQPSGTPATDGGENQPPKNEQTPANDGGENKPPKGGEAEPPKATETCDKCGKPKGECTCGKGEGKDCGEGKAAKTEPPKGTPAKDEAEVARDLAAGHALAEKAAQEIGAFDHAEMGEAQVAHYICEKLGVAFDSAEGELGFAKGFCSQIKEPKTVRVNAGDSAESAAKSEAMRTAKCRAAYLGE